MANHDSDSIMRKFRHIFIIFLFEGQKRGRVFFYHIIILTQNHKNLQFIIFAMRAHCSLHIVRHSLSVIVQK